MTWAKTETASILEVNHKECEVCGLKPSLRISRLVGQHGTEDHHICRVCAEVEVVGEPAKWIRWGFRGGENHMDSVLHISWESWSRLWGKYALSD